MSLLHVEYDMDVRYERTAGQTFFTIKCIPYNDKRQKLISLNMEIKPAVPFDEGKDSFGNGQIYGSVIVPHERFSFHMSGDVETQDSPETGTDTIVQSGIYRYPYGKCRPWPGIDDFLGRLPLESCRDEYDRCILILKALNQEFSYVKNATTVRTTAREAWEKGCGVCQDFAHIYITMLRKAGIPARYVCGFVFGEGESHAWAEAFCGGKWFALDPTQGQPVTDLYIKLGHGRDASDCPINKGIILGGGSQVQHVRASVVQL